MEKQKIQITQQDIRKGFDNCYECALATAAKRALGIRNLQVGCFSINQYDSKGDEWLIGRIDPPFDYSDFSDMKNGKIKEFITEFIPLSTQRGNIKE